MSPELVPLAMTLALVSLLAVMARMFTVTIRPETERQAT